MAQTIMIDGAKVRRRIALRGMTQTGFASEHGLDVSHFSRLLTNRTGASGPYLARLATALECEPAEIVTDKVKPTKRTRGAA